MGGSRRGLAHRRDDDIDGEAEQAIRAAKAEAAELPLVVMVTVDEAGNCLDGTTAETAAERMTAWGADAVGCNCSWGPAVVLSVIERMRGATHRRWRRCRTRASRGAVEGRTIYMTSPEYMASFARKFVRAGTTFCGGCCGTTPHHVRAVRNALRALTAQEQGTQEQGSGKREEGGVQATTSGGAVADWGEDRRRGVCDAGRDRAAEGDRLLEGTGRSEADACAGGGWDQRAGLAAGERTDERTEPVRTDQQQVGIETVLHYTCRDRNILGIQGDLLGLRRWG